MTKLTNQNLEDHAGPTFSSEEDFGARPKPSRTSSATSFASMSSLDSFHTAVSELPSPTPSVTSQTLVEPVSVLDAGSSQRSRTDSTNSQTSFLSRAHTATTTPGASKRTASWFGAFKSPRSLVIGSILGATALGTCFAGPAALLVGGLALGIAAGIDLRRNGSKSVLGQAANKVAELTEKVAQKVGHGARVRKAGAERHPYPTLPEAQAALVSKKASREAINEATRFLVHHDARFAGNAAFDAIEPPHAPELVLDRGVLKKLTQVLVNLKTRETSQISLGAGKSLVEIKQRFVRMDFDAENDVFVPKLDQTLSSEAIKHDNLPQKRHLRSYNANLATVMADDKLLLVRSARADSPQRIEELLLAGALAQGRTDAPYRGVIISALDQSPIKAGATRALGGETETEMLLDQKHAVAALFGEAQTLERKVQGPMGPQSIILERPVLLNLVMSSQAKSPRELVRARMANGPEMLRLAQRLGDSWQASGGSQAAFGAAITQHLMEGDFASWLATDEAKTMSQMLPQAQAEALDGLKLTLTGKDFSGDEHMGPTASIHETLLLRRLLGQTGAVAHVQCKSGQDRTLSLVSLLTAAHVAEREGGVEASSPNALAEERGLGRFQQFFTQTAEALGRSPITDVRGEMGKTKWGFVGPGRASHPVPALLYTPEQEDGIGLKKGAKSSSRASSQTKVFEDA